MTSSFEKNKKCLISDHNLPFQLEKIAFNHWLDALNTDSEPKTLSTVSFILETLNTVEIVPKIRLFFLLKLSVLIEQLSQPLQEPYQGSLIPFSKSHQSMIQTSCTCSSHIAQGYALLCKDKHFKSSTFFSNHEKTLIVYGGIRAQSNILLYKSIRYEKTEKGFWHLCFFFYSFALKNNVSDYQVNNSQLSFINAFKRLLVFELSNTQQFSVEEILNIFYLLDKVASSTELLSQLPTKNSKEIPFIELDKDKPPLTYQQSQKDQQSSNLIYIFNLKLIKQLLGTLSNQESSKNYSKTTLLRLIKTLTLSEHRKSKREPSSGAVLAVFGINEIIAFTVLHEQNKQLEKKASLLQNFELIDINCEPQQRNMDDFTTEVHAGLSFVNDAEQSKGLNSQVKSSEIWISNKINTPTDKKNDASSNVELLDKSSTGYRLHLLNKENEITVGEMVCLIIDQIKVLTVIRRLIQEKENEFQIGLEVIGKISKTLHIINMDSKGAITGLYLNNGEEHQSVVIQAGQYKDEPFLFTNENNKTRKYLVEKQLNTSLLAQHLKITRC